MQCLWRCCRIYRAGRVAGLQKVFHRLAAHAGVDVQVADTERRARLFQHKEDHTVVDEPASVASAQQVAFFGVKGRPLKGSFLVFKEGREVYGLRHAV